MAYISLYRRFRPDTFDKVIGQEHIVKTLVNQIKNKAVGHAYLFTGTRGTGKTSVAKILARAVNCDSPVNGSPCGKCHSCQEMKLSTNFDILEIDAASNNSVDQIRELTEKINYAPVKEGGYKVYIIDEVHMLTKSAYNALLKTLEEPPSHAIFILCTTEVQAIPQTILSRCLRFDFRLIPTAKLVSHLKSVYDAVGAKYEDDALMLIAQAGAGSVRDTLSIADMCLSYCGEKVTYAGVLEVLGESDPHSIITLANDILSGNLSLALEKVAKIVDLGKSIQTLSSSLAETFRNMMFVKKCSTANKFLGLPQDIFESLDKVQRNYQAETLLNAMKKFTALEGEFRYSSQHRILLEAAIVEVGLFENGETEKKTIIAQKQTVRSLQAANTVKAEENTKPSKESEAENIDVKAVPSASVNQTPSTNENGKITVSMTDDLAKKANQIWGFVMAAVLGEMDRMGSDSFLKFAVSDAEPKIVDGKFVVYFADGQPYTIATKPDNKAFLRKAISDVTDMDCEFKKKLVLDEDNTVDYLKSMFGDDITIKK